MEVSQKFLEQNLASILKCFLIQETSIKFQQRATKILLNISTNEGNFYSTDLPNNYYFMLIFPDSMTIQRL